MVESDLNRITLLATWEIPYERCYVSHAMMVNDKYYYCYFTEDGDRYRGWIMSVPGHNTEKFVDAATKEEAEKIYNNFLYDLGG